MSEGIAVAERNDAEHLSSQVDHSKRMTNVVSYAKKIGIDYDVYISPRVLLDVQDVPSEHRMESDFTRLMIILGEVKRVVARARHEATIPFSGLISLGSRSRDEVPDEDYKLLAHILKDGSVEISRPDETKSKNSSQLTAEKIKDLRKNLSPPRTWWKADIN